MALNVLILPDKFKGTLTAAAAAACIADGWRQARPDDVLSLLPMNDGGDGFGEITASLLCAEPRPLATVDAAHRPQTATWWYARESRTAVIDSAGIIGLALLPPKVFHPFALDTFGLGTVLQAAAGAGAKRCLIGIGGSATNDAGFGLARALGWQFLAADGRRLERWTELVVLDSIRPPREQIAFDELVIAVDVQNPLLGPRGAARVYGPQKGLRPEDFAAADAAFERLAQICQRDLQSDCALEPGTGAAGGLGFGLRTFLSARFEPGFALFARLAGLDERLRRADLVITAEGAIDQSTLMGKGVGELALRCRELRVPCLGLAGSVDPRLTDEQTRALFVDVRGVVPALTDLESAKARAAHWLTCLATEAARHYAPE